MKKISSKFWKVITRITCAMFLVLSCAFCFVACSGTEGDFDPNGDYSSSVIDWNSFKGYKFLYTANPNRPDATKTLEANKLISMFNNVAEEVLYKFAVEYGLGFGLSNYTDYYNVIPKTTAVGEGASEWTLTNGTVYTKADVTGTDSSSSYTIKTGFAFGDVILPVEIGTQKDIVNWTNFSSTEISETITATDFINNFIETNKKELVAEMINQNLGLSGTSSALTGASSESTMLNVAKNFTYYGLKENGIKALSERITSLVNTTEATETAKDEDFVKLFERTVYTLNEDQTASETQPATIVKVGSSYFTYDEVTFEYAAVTISDETVYTAGEKSIFYYVFDVNHDGLINGNEVNVENVKSAKTVGLGYKNIANFVAKTFDEAIANNLISELGATYFYNIYIQDYSNSDLFSMTKLNPNNPITLPEENYVGMIYMFSSSFGTRYAEMLLLELDSDSAEYKVSDYHINYDIFYSPKGTGVVTSPIVSDTASLENAGYEPGTRSGIEIWGDLKSTVIATSGEFVNNVASGDPDINNGNPNALKTYSSAGFNVNILTHMKQVTVGQGDDSWQTWQWVDAQTDVLGITFTPIPPEDGTVQNVPSNFTYKIINPLALYFDKEI